MQMITKKINGNYYSFVCNSRNTRNGFAHDCTLFHGEKAIAKATANYLNRTWESYRYQSVMLSAVSKAIRDEKNDITEQVKDLNGWKNLNEKRRNFIEQMCDNDAGIRNLRELKNAI